MSQAQHKCSTQEAAALVQEKLYFEKMQKLSQMSAEEAKELLFHQFKEEVAQESALFLLKQKEEIENQAEKRAQAILVTAINRLSLSTTTDAAITVISLPSHEMKGRIIGREGRNIRILEEATGVNFIIDDTPNAVLISSFDPLRKEIAKGALKELIQDGRIHPTRIEEVVSKWQKKVAEQIEIYGQRAASLAGPFSFHPELIKHLGKLHFCYHLGQNILSHSLEVSALMGIMAAELHLDCELAKRIGILHDIGKAVPQDREGSHALIGEQLALKYGESDVVSNGIGAHHGESDPHSLEATLCMAANTISAERPGARSEVLEHYFKKEL